MACWDGQEQVYRHVCQEPSGSTCVEQECDSPAGTWWTPLWCPDHDLVRLNRISNQFAKLAEGFRELDMKRRNR